MDFSDSPVNNVSRRTYLLTYSKADMVKSPNCSTFALSVIETFRSGNSSAELMQWAVCLENHSDGLSRHYHMAVKLSGTRRWYAIAKYLYDNCNIAVNFSSEHCGYVAAYRYVCKEKPVSDVLHSKNHPNLSQVGSSPKTKNAMKTFSSNAQKRKSVETSTTSAPPPPKHNKPKRLSNSDVAAFLIKNNLKDESHLMVVAKQRNDNGESDIYNFVLNKSPKALADLINTAWKMQNAEKNVERSEKSRMDILMDYVTGECVTHCLGTWFTSAKEVLLSKT